MTKGSVVNVESGWHEYTMAYREQRMALCPFLELFGFCPVDFCPELNWMLGLLTETISTHKSLCPRKD